MSTENTLKRKSHKLQSNQTEAVFGAFVEETPALMGTGEILAPTATAATQESAVSAGTEAASDAAPTLEVIHMDDSIRATDEELANLKVVPPLPSKSSAPSAAGAADAVPTATPSAVAQPLYGADDPDATPLKASVGDQLEVSKKELYSWYIYEWSNHVYTNTVLNAFLPGFMVAVAVNNEDNDHKFTFFPGVRLSGANYYPTVVPISVVCQLIFFVLLGAMGDYGSMRKRMLIVMTVSGALCTIAFGAVSNAAYWLSGLLLVMTNVLYGLAIIFYNAFMPVLTAGLPEVRNAPPGPERENAEAANNSRISNCGYIFGYTGSLVLLIINVGIGFATKSSCSQWCRDCPTANGTATLPGWNAYAYVPQGVMFNTTMDHEKAFCDSTVGRLCTAWPGTHPPCGVGADGFPDIDANMTCRNASDWSNYLCDANGCKRSLSFGNISRAAYPYVFSSSQTPSNQSSLPLLDSSTFLCINPRSPDDSRTQQLTDAQIAALTLDANVTGGCAHFRCGRIDCSVNSNPVTCDDNNIGYRADLASAGIWWLGFAMITFIWLKPRPSPPLPAGVTYASISVRKFVSTFKKIRKLKNTFLFLMAYWIYSDGFATVGFGATLIAVQAPLFFSTLGLGILLLEVNITALLGNLFYSWIGRIMVRRWRKREAAKGNNTEALDGMWASKYILFVNFFFVMVLPIWATPGLGGLNNQVEFYLAGALYGFQVGSVGAYSRSILQHMTPEGCESEFFSFYELTDKGTSWLGPILLSVMGEATGQTRWGFFSIIIFLVVGAAILTQVDTQKGAIDALNFELHIGASGKSKKEDEPDAYDASLPVTPVATSMIDVPLEPTLPAVPETASFEPLSAAVAGIVSDAVPGERESERESVRRRRRTKGPHDEDAGVNFTGIS